MQYTIRYNHTSSTRATSLRDALRIVRAEAGVNRLRHYSGSDGLYLWRTTEDMHRDSDGSRAYAVIESPAQRALHG